MSDHAQRRSVRWGRFFVVVFLVLLALGLLTHWMWSIGARGRLDRQVAVYRTAGEPIELEDFIGYGVIPGENAVPELLTAAKTIDPTTAAWEAFNDAELTPPFPLRPDEIEMLRALLAENASALRAVESAAAKPGVDWELSFQRPLINLMLPELNGYRALANLLMADALLAHAEGDDTRALRRVDHLLFLSRVMGRQPILVCHLVSIGIGAVASNVSVDLAADLRIGSAPGEATAQQVRDLIAQLLDEKPLDESHRDAWLGERMFQYEMARDIERGTVVPNGQPAKGKSLLGRALTPTFLDDATLMARYTTAVSQASAAAPSWPAFQRTAPARPDTKQTWRHVLANILLPSLDRAVETKYRALADRRIAATSLAARLYAADHAGRLLDSLDQLLPDYLPALPQDTFAPTTQPLRYQAAPNPIVYSVGKDGVDDRGSEQRATNARGHDRWTTLDAVAHLTRQPRPTPEAREVYDLGEAIEAAPDPTTQPADAAP